MKIINIFMVLLIGQYLLTGCKSLETNLTIKEKEIPSTWETGSTSESISTKPWKEYFADPILIGYIDTALQNNQNLQIAIQRIEIAKSGVRISRSDLFPNVQGDLYTLRNKYAKYTQENAGNSTTEFEGKVLPNPISDMALGLTANWEIDIWGKLQQKRKSALARYLSTIEAKNFIVSNLIGEIASNYYELTAIDQSMQLLDSTILKQTQALEAIRLQQEAGLINLLGVQQLEAQALQLSAQRNELLQKANELENNLNFLLGRYPTALQRNSTKIPSLQTDAMAIGSPGALLSSRPDIREAELLLESARCDVQAARAAFFPSFNVMATLGLQSFEPAQLFNLPTSLGLSAFSGLASPLINRNAIKAEFSAAKASQLEAMYTYQQTIMQAYFEVATEYQSLLLIQETIAIEQQRSTLLNSSALIARDLFNAARANYLEVLLAQQNALEANMSLIQLYKDQQLVGINLYKALGGGWK
jgi:outer membrane protein, multidrug efflux system